MLIPGSQARLFVGPSAYATGFALTQMVIMRFRRANVRPRVPRLDGTNSEGLPGAVRGANWPAAPAPALLIAGSRYPSFKEYPYETQVPGVGICDLEIEQATWDFDQIIYQFPVLNTHPIMPGRYVSAIFMPNFRQTGARFAYTFSHIYIEETPHRADVKDLQPLTVTGYTSGPWTYPMPTSGGGVVFPTPHLPVHGGAIPTV